MTDGSSSATTTATSRHLNGSIRGRHPAPAHTQDTMVSTAYASGAASTSPAPPPLKLSAAPPGPGLRRPAATPSSSQTVENGDADLSNNDSDPSNDSSDYSNFDMKSSQHHFSDTFERPSSQHETSNWHSLPLVFALLPALGGLVFKNGSAFVSDILLLGLGAAILHWSITEPWKLYNDTQEIVVSTAEEPFLDDYDNDYDEDLSGDGDSPVDAFPKDGLPSGGTTAASDAAPKLTERQRAAVKELRLHERLALISLFVFPILSTLVLHCIRTQLSRPSEVIISNYHLAIFLAAAEIRPVRHLHKLWLARTWHVQRVVPSNPFADASLLSRLEQLTSRLEQLEERAAADKMQASADEVHMENREAMIIEAQAQFRREIKPLYRTVRGFEKKHIILCVQIDNRLRLLDERVEDAVAYAAHAAKSGHYRPQPSIWSSAWDQTVALSLMPFRGWWLLMSMPFRLVKMARVLRPSIPGRSGQGYRSSRSSRSSSASADRYPSRLSSRR